MVDALSRGEVAGQERKGAPREREPEVAVEAAAEELEVVGERHKSAHGHERADPGLDGDRAKDADRDGRHERSGAENDQQRCRYPRP